MKSLKIIVAAALVASMLVGCGSTSDDKAIYNFSSEADVTSLDSSVSDDGVSFNAIHAFSEGLMDITARVVQSLYQLLHHLISYQMMD